MFTAQIITNSIITASIYGLLAIGFTIIYSTVRFFDLSYAGIPVVAAYITLLFSKVLGLSLWAGIPLGILSGAITSWLVYMLVYKPLRVRKASNTIFLVAALGVYTVLISIIPMFFTSQFQTLSNLTNIQTIHISGAVITNIQLITAILFVIIGIVIWYVMQKTRLGRAIRAVADDEEVTKTMGINTEKIISKVFLIGGAIGGLAGVMIGLDTGMDPNIGFNLLLKAVIACIIGGVGNIYAAIVGALVLAGIENVGVWYFSAEWKDLIAFAVLILFLIIRPGGIFKK
jgi:branched-chain amino acid transport system permease protein